MEISNLVTVEAMKTSYFNKGVAKFKIPGELTEAESEEVVKLFTNLLYCDEKIIIEHSYVYNDESFTQFIFKYKKVTIESMYDMFKKMEAIAIDLNNMHGTMAIDEEIKLIKES